MSTLKVCVVGCGGISNAHIPAIKKISELQIVGLCDILPDRPTGQNKRYGLSAKEYTDYRTMICELQPDVVHVCTPNYLHSEIACFAMEHGAHCICEKPESITMEQIYAIRDTEKATGKRFMAIRNNRYGYAAQELKKKADNGDFGDLYTGRCGYIRARGIPSWGGWFTDKTEAGGGPLIDLGVHMIDLAIDIMGFSKPLSVTGRTYTKFGKNDAPGLARGEEYVPVPGFTVEDLAIGFVTFEDGRSLQIEFSWASNIYKGDAGFVELRGTLGGFKWENDGTYELYKNGYVVKSALLRRIEKIRQHVRIHSLHYENIRHFTDVLLYGATPKYTIEQGITMIKILTGLYESAETGREVRFDS